MVESLGSPCETITAWLKSCSPIQLPWWLRWSGICLLCRTPGFDPWVRKIPWRRKWQPIPVSFLEHSTHRGAWCATVHEVAELDKTEWFSLTPIQNKKLGEKKERKKETAFMALGSLESCGTWASGSWSSCWVSGRCRRGSWGVSGVKCQLWTLGWGLKFSCVTSYLALNAC